MNSGVRNVWTIFAAATVLALTVTAQQPPAASPPSNFHVEGTILDAETGQPLENIGVQASTGRYCCSPGESHSTTGKDGSFTLPLKTSANYVVKAESDKYIADWSGALTQCSPCTVTLRLHATATFSGRVVAADTLEPISRVTVEAFAVSPDTGSMAAISRVGAITDRNGDFSLKRLVPGQYFFLFTPVAIGVPLLVPDAHADIHDSTARKFVRQWWPGGDAWQHATPFTIMAGTDFRLPDVRIPAESRFQVSGTVVADSCQAGDTYTVAIGRHRGAGVDPFRSMLVRCGAEFAFQDLTPGRYQISLLSTDRTEEQTNTKVQTKTEAREELVVTDRNLEQNLAPAR